MIKDIKIKELHLTTTEDIKTVRAALQLFKDTVKENLAQHEKGWIDLDFIKTRKEGRSLDYVAVNNEILHRIQTVLDKIEK